MRERLTARLLDLLRVPPEPQVPVEARDVRVFRAAPAYFRYRVATWALTQLFALIGLVTGYIFVSAEIGDLEGLANLAVKLFEIVAWAAFGGQALFSLAVLRLDFDMRWYILSDRSLRIREGVVTVREKTMTFANIQNISIRQNPIQRIFGIYDVEVRSAGGGAGDPQGSGVSKGDSAHLAHFHGVDNPEEIRTAIRERIRLHRDSGLGDPDEAAQLVPAEPVAGDGTHAALEAARELRYEMRLLRHALEDSIVRR